MFCVNFFYKKYFTNIITVTWLYLLLDENENVKKIYMKTSFNIKDKKEDVIGKNTATNPMMDVEMLVTT